MPHPFEFIPIPAERSLSKPRQTGRTMMIDWGLDLRFLPGFLEQWGHLIDIAKIPVGSARLYTEQQLADKLGLYREHDIHSFIGGGFVEHVVAHHGEEALPRFFEECRRVQLDIVEISDNYITLTPQQRIRQIELARSHGLIVYGEVGSKHVRNDAEMLAAQARDCFEAGAELVLLEGAEFMTEQGQVNRGLLDDLRHRLDMSRVLFELPGPWLSGCDPSGVHDIKKFLINEFGPQVNLANVVPDDIMETETLRLGLGVVQRTTPLSPMNQVA